MHQFQQFLLAHDGAFAYLLTIFLGISLSRFHFVGRPVTLLISKFLVRLFYPALILSTIPKQYSAKTLMEDWPIPLLAASVVALGFLIGKLSFKWFWPNHREERGTYLFMCSMPNYIFLPLPICSYLWGERAVALLVFSTLGADLAMWGLAVPQLRGSRISIRGIFSFPMMALLAALLIVLFDTEKLWLSSSLPSYLSSVGTATIPLSLFLLGCHFGNIMSFDYLSKSHFFISTVRLAIVPTLMFAALWYLPIPNIAKQVMLLVASMPVAISSIILTEMYGGNSRRAAEQILFSHLLCIPTVYFWMEFALPHLISH